MHLGEMLTDSRITEAFSPHTGALELSTTPSVIFLLIRQMSKEMCRGNVLTQGSGQQNTVTVSCPPVMVDWVDGLILQSALHWK